METRQRRSFTDDYKRQAVDLVASSGRSIGLVAKELGLRDDGMLPLICPTCQNVCAGKASMPATPLLLCMGLFSIF